MMKAVVYVEYQGELVVTDVPKPKLKDETSLIVKITAAGYV